MTTEGDTMKMTVADLSGKHLGQRVRIGGATGMLRALGFETEVVYTQTYAGDSDEYFAPSHTAWVQVGDWAADVYTGLEVTLL